MTLAGTKTRLLAAVGTSPGMGRASSTAAAARAASSELPDDQNAAGGVLDVAAQLGSAQGVGVADRTLEHNRRAGFVDAGCGDVLHLKNLVGERADLAVVLPVGGVGDVGVEDMGIAVNGLVMEPEVRK